MKSKLEKKSRLSPAELSRYERHLVLPEVGHDGQLKLKASKVLIVGAGGLGSSASLYLAAAGVGQIGIVDFDKVSLSNLQRQVLYRSDEIGLSKMDCAATRLHSLNPEISVIGYPFYLDEKNIEEAISDYNVILDCSDNFDTRYLINDYCAALEKPIIFGAIQGFDGQVSIFCHPEGPCYRCLYPEPPASGTFPNCVENGVLGVLPGIVGTLQATEALKLILGIGESLIGKLLQLDTLAMRFSTFEVTRNPKCPSCSLKGRNKVEMKKNKPVHPIEELTDDENLEIDPGEFTALLNEYKKTQTQLQLVDVRTEIEFRAGHLKSAIHLPLHELEDRFNELDPNKTTILYCHAGVRSLTALAILKQAGFKRVRHLRGGLIALQL
jgi:molybdopterin/thiamine biosynthesis adenylyltransferase/rhodanese-related sulfurtransferase